MNVDTLNYLPIEVGDTISYTKEGLIYTHILLNEINFLDYVQNVCFKTSHMRKIKENCFEPIQ